MTRSLFVATTALVTSLLSPLVHAEIISGSVTNDFGFALPWAVVEVRDSGGNIVGSSNPEEDEFWEVTVPGPGDYYANVVNWSVNGFTPEAYDDIFCDGCDPSTEPGTTVIQVTGGDVGGINFVISGGFSISGHVQDSGANNLDDLEVCALKVVHELHLGCALTDISGNYVINGIQDTFNDITVRIEDSRGHPVFQEMWDNLPCCDISQADIIDMSGGSVAGIDFVLEIGTPVSGELLSEFDGPVTEGAVTAFLPNGDFVTNGSVDGSGQWSMLLAPGDYHVFFEAWGAFEAYIDEFQDETPCAQQSCGDWPNNLTPVSVTAAPLVLNNTLNRGILISGTVLDESSNPLPDAHVDIHDEFQNHIGTVWADSGTGEWFYPVSSSGNYYANTPDWSIPGFVPEVWDDHPCVNCDLFAVADPIVVSGSDVSGIDFVLGPGYQIFFQINDEGSSPIGEGYVEIFDASGNHIETAWNNGDGTAQSSVLPEGTYYAYAYGEDWNRTTQLHENISCPFGACDVVAEGTPIIISGADAGPFAFALSWRDENWTISGHIWDAEGNSDIGGNVAIFNQIGQEVGHWWVDGDGYFESHQLPDGTYYAITRQTQESLDKAWDDIPCVNSTCDPTTTTPIVVSGDNVSGINFFLDPITGGGRIQGSLLDDLGNPVPYAGVVVFNQQGNYLTEMRADPAGFFSSVLLANDDYYVRTEWEPLGLARELWVATESVGNPDLNVLCPVPWWDCDNSGFLSSNGTLVNINNGDTGGIDFVLKVPPGGQITGHVSDQLIWDQEAVDFPLINVELALLKGDGGGNWNHIANTQADRDGNYTFSGLDDGDYKLFTQWIHWPGFEPECYGGQFCDWGTDFNDPANGDVITISGGSIFDPADLGLDFMGERIVGTVTRSDTGEPVSGQQGHVGVELFDDGGNHQFGEGVNEAGQYQLMVWPGNFMLTAEPDSNAHNLINQIWDGTECFGGCNPPADGGDVIDLTGGGTFLADFVLNPGTIISGRATAANGGAPIADIEICTARQSDGWWAGCGWTDGNGDYQIKALEPRDDYEVFTNNLNGQPFAGANWPGLVSTLGGDQGGIDFVLGEATPVSGTMLSEFDGPVTEGGVTAYLSNGDHVAFAHVDGSGFWSMALPPGDYHFFFEAWGAFEAYIDEFQDDTPCSQQHCGDWPNDLTPVAVMTSPLTLDNTLNRGFLISGTVLDGASNAIEDAHVDIFDESFEFIGNYRTDSGTGFWQFPVAYSGNYYVITPDWSIPGFVPEVWDDHPCGNCDWPSIADPIVVSGSDVGGIDFVLGPGYQISFLIENEVGSLINEGYVEIFDASGNHIETAWNNGDGTAQSSVLPDGTYYAYAYGEDWNRTSELYNGIACPFGACDIVGLGTPIIIGGGDVGPLTFELSWRSEDWTISGHIWNADGDPEPGGNVAIYNQIGQEIGHWWVDGDGYFETSNLPDGTYFAKTRNTWQTLDEAWDNIPCTNQLCDPTTATPIVINGDHVGDINFFLDPIANPTRIHGTLTNAVGTPLPSTDVVFFNSNGDYLFGDRSDEAGYYISGPLPPDVYYVSTDWEPDGLMRELWAGGEPGNVQCTNDWECHNPDFMLAYGMPVDTTGGDVHGIDFELELPGGNIISGQVRDEVTNAPLPLVHLAIMRGDGEHVASRRTDPNGNYAFSALPDDEYRIFIEGPPEDYQQEIWDDVPCDWSCDFSIGGDGTGIPVAGGGVFPGHDFDLTWAGGERIIVSVERASSGEPIPDVRGQMLFVLYDESGNWLDQVGSDMGTRWFHVGPGNYYVIVQADVQHHNTINEVFDDLHCYDDCHPLSHPGASLIPINPGDTGRVEFALEEGNTISGQVTAAVGGAPVADVEICTARQSDGWWAGCAWTDGNGDYGIKGLEPRNDYEVFTNNLNGQPFQGASWPGLVDTTAGNVGGIDLVLDAAFSITGTLTDAITSAPVVGQFVCIGRLDGNVVQGSCSTSDSNGDYASGSLETGSDYVAFVIGSNTPYRSTMWDGIDCPWNWCDLTLGNPIEVGNPGDATGIDFALSANTVLAGTIYSDDGSGPVPHSFARARLYRVSDGSLVATNNTNGNGEWAIQSVIPDDYYLVSTPRFGSEIDEVYNDVACPRLSCDLGQPGVQVITINDGDVIGGIDATLVPGSRLSGWLTADGNPHSASGVFIYTPAGALAGFGFPDENGYWESGSGLPAGDYYVATHSSDNPDINSEFFNLVAPNRPCGDPCDLTVGDLITVNGVDGVNDINFDLISNAGGSQVLIAGQVMDDLGNPLSGIHIDILDSNGNFVAGRDSDGGGSWAVPVDAGQDYFALTTEWSTGSHIPEIWDDVPCNGCNPATEGTQISVGTDTVLGINFELVTGNTLNGLVTDELDATPLENVTVCAARLDNFRWIGCRNTDASGYYEFGGIEPRDDIVPFIWDLAGQLYVPEVYDNKLCCDWWNGDTVAALLSGNATVDFALARSGSQSGRVIDSVSLMGIPGVQVSLNDEQCQQVATAQTDANGDYTITGFTGGIYRAYADASTLGYIRELYPDVKTYRACSPEFNDAQPIVMADEEVAFGLDMDLDIGGIISGFISGPGGVLGRNQGQARMYDPDGNQLLVLNNREPDDSYLLGGLLPGTFYVVLSSRGQGLIDEVYDDVQCPRFSCGPAPAVPIVVGPGDIVANIDATLEEGSLIGGRLTDAATGQPLAFHSVAIYTETGQYASFGSSDENGDWTSRTALPAGNYLVSNQFRIVDQFDAVEGGYLPMVWPDRTCGEPCDFLLGDLVTVDGTPVNSVGGIDFAMELGASITGNVTDGGSGLTGVDVQMLSSADGSLIRTVTTDGAGQYAINGVGSGDYFLRTSNMLGYEDQLYAGFSCNPFCDPLTGTAVTVLPADTTVGPFNFALLTAPTISGVVQDDPGMPVGGVDVVAYDALGSEVSRDTSDGAGAYTITNLYAGDFYVASDNSAGYVDALYDGGICLPGCDPTLGTAVSVAAGTGVSGIDLELGSASVISGNVNDGASPIGGVTVEVYRDTGAFVDSAISGGGGNYSVGGLAAGDYHVVTRNAFGYIDEGGGGGICQTTCPPTSTATITVPLNSTVNVGFGLDFGGQITGTVSDTALTPLQSVTIKAYNSAGVLISSSTTGPAGTYTINSLAGGNVYLRTSNSLGYLNQRYDGLDCDALCDVLAATPVAVTVGNTVSGTDFELPLGGSISGTVRNAAAAGISGVQLQVFDDAGLLAGFAVSTGGGGYSVTGLEDGDYRIRSVNAAGYVDLVRGGDNCSPEPCDLFSGTVTTVASSDETGVDVTLQLGDQISGVATNDMGVPLPSGTAQVYSATGQLVKEGGIFNGIFLVNGLANGTYYMLVLNGSGLVDQLWQSIPCPGGSCDVTTGTPIVLSGAATQAITSPLASNSGRGSKVQAPGAGTRLDFALQRGTRLRGSLRNDSGAAIKFAKVYFFNSAGVLAGQTTTDGLGNFVSTSSFPNGTWFAATSAPGKGGVGGGLIDEIYDNVACAGECNPAIQAGTPVVISGGSAAPIDFVLGSGKAISGQVSVIETGLPLSVATIELFKADGSPAASRVTDGSGNYRFDGLLPGTYFVLASHPSGTYSTVLYNGIDCSAGCDVTSGDPLAMANMDIAMVDFALSDGSCPYQPGPGHPDSDGDGIVDECEQYPPIIDPGAIVHDSVQIGDGTVIEQDVLIDQRVSIGQFSWIRQWSVIRKDASIGDYVVIDRNVLIENQAVIGDDVSIGQDCEIAKNVHIGDRVQIGLRCDVRKAVTIENDVVIGMDVLIKDNAIIGAGAWVGNDVQVGKDAIVMPGSVVPDGTRIKNGEVWP